jgi:hypothetical protein
VPIDWSTSHLVFSRPEPGSEAEFRVQQELRFWLQSIRRSQPVSMDSAAIDVQAAPAVRKRRKKKLPIKPDWSFTLGGSGSTVGSGKYPAKFTFFTNNTPDCANDFVVFNTSLAGSSTQASILAYSNLYNNTTCSPDGTPRTQTHSFTNGSTAVGGSGGNTFNITVDPGAVITGSGIPNDTVLTTVGGNAHTGTISKAFTGTTGNVNISILQVPKVLWAYNTNGTVNGVTVAGAVKTSPVLSFGGTQVAFVHAGVSGTAASLVLLKWAASTSQAVTLPGTPTGATAAGYRSCTAPCFTALAFNGGITHLDSNSAPFVDYNSDTLYVGDDTGTLHKFSGVFSGTPAEVTTGGWPVTANLTALSSPVFDFTSGNVFVGNVAGTLARVNALTGAVTTSGALATTIGIQDAPLVDGSAGQVYVFSANNLGNSSVIQLSTSFASADVGNAVSIGASSTTRPIFSGAFDNTYLTSANSGNPTGNLYVCGNAGGNAQLFRVPITTNTMSAPVAITATISNAPATCSPVTEFFKSPNDEFFLSVQASGNTAAAIGCLAGNPGCIVSFATTTTLAAGATTTARANETGGTSGIVVDNISSQTGASQVYFSPLSDGTCATNPNGSTGCAIQASQAALQ